MTRNTDALFLYNERETIVDPIVKRLDESGYATFFWRRDTPYAEKIDKLEAEHLETTTHVLLLLGEYGWGPNHLRLAQKAIEQEKKPIPVLIGNPPEGALEELNGYFKEHRWVDLRAMDEQGYFELFNALGSPGEFKASGKFDSIIAILRDGNRRERSKVIQQIKESKNLDRLGLSIQLRDEIERRYSDKYAHTLDAPRNIREGQIARFWMLSALIYTEAEGFENRSLLLDHLKPDIENDETIRYYVLGGLYHRNVSYFESVLEIAQSDPSPLIALMVQLMRSPENNETIQNIRNSIKILNAETTWITLRTLRIVPVPQLVDDICRIIIEWPVSNSTYDALYALLHKDMVVEAAGIFRQSGGASLLLQKMLTISINSESNALYDFTYLLSQFDKNELKQAFSEAANDERNIKQIELIQQYLKEYHDAESESEFNDPGLNSDIINVKNDWLNIAQDVKALTAVMLSRDLTPPLAIGLYGDWGTGKTFFMKSLQQEVNDPKTKARKKYYSNVVQIDFNAWHYVDTNLWASLTDKIIDELDAYVSPEKTFESKKSDLENKLSEKENSVKELSSEQESKRKKRIELKEELEKLKIERESKPVRIKELTKDDIYEILGDEQKKELEQSLDTIGYNKVIETGEDLKAVLAEASSLRSRMSLLVVGTLQSSNKWLIIFLLVCILILFPFLSWLLFQYFHVNNFLLSVNTFIVEITTVIGGGIMIMKSGLKHVNNALNVVVHAKDKVDALLKSKREELSEEEKQKTKELQELESGIEKLKGKLSTTKEEIEALENKMKSLNEEYSLNHFLSDVKKSQYYKEKLGVISQVRRHFDELIDRLKRSQTPGSIYKPVDRIILYIDDLDRCPENKVLEVLQAVHLMLAYPLFVIVVGVDPRWLLNSLKLGYAVLNNSKTPQEGQPDLWQPTPQNFLEKIFQIPFCLRPMSQNGFSDLMSNLLKGKIETSHPALETPKEQSKKEEQSQENQTAHSSAENTTQHTESVPPTPPKTENTPPPVEEVSDESLIIKKWEADFAGKLHLFITTPRAAKRFTNIYRILKAAVPKQQLPTFEGSAELPGEYQIVMILLAILTGQPQHSFTWFSEIKQQALKNKGIQQALSKLQSDEKLPKELNQKLLDLAKQNNHINDPSILTKWLPLVSRFSFELGKVFIKDEMEVF